MQWDNYLKWLEITYRTEINHQLRTNIKEHFRNDLKISTDEELYVKSTKIIQDYKSRYYIKQHNKYYYQ